MESFELEDLTLWLIRDADEAEMWIDRWAVSYPLCRCRSVRKRQHGSVAKRASDGIRTDTGQAYRRCRTRRGRGRILGVAVPRRHPDAEETRRIILVSPRPDIFPTMRNTLSNASAVLAVPHWWCPNTAACRTVGRKTGGFVERPPVGFPHSGSLNGMLGGWQWGMKLMQEMLLA